MIEEFIELLKNQAIIKEKLYDGCDRNFDIDIALRFAIEELGEIASAITRNRFELAESECIDLAHCAMLIWLSLKRKD